MTMTTSSLPRKQRASMYNRHNVEKRRQLRAPLSTELRTRYARRNVTIRKGDTARIISGSFEGREERVAKVNVRDGTVTLDNVTLKKADAKLKPLPLKPAHLVLTRLNLADPWRRQRLKVPEGEGLEESPAPSISSTPPAEKPAATATSESPKAKEASE
ncbi:MAG: 50S ribosomal protein L24 [Thermoplasmata archaeon]|nr:50S ribosomal protein L24 [Thermoplasmata archaeon]